MVNIPLYIPKDVDKYFYNRKKDIAKLNYYINSLNEGISQQLLVTGYRGVGKTFLLKKIMKDINPNILVTYIDISQIYAKEKGNLTEEGILIELLSSMNNILLNHQSSNLKKISKQIELLINNLKLKNYDFKDAATILDIPIPNTETNYNKLSKFVMEFPQKIVESSEELDGFLIIFDEFQMITNLENDDAFFWLLRSFNQFQDNVSYIMTGSLSRTSSTIAKVNGESGAFGGRMIQINIEPFSKEESKSYLENKIRDIKFSEDGFDRFYECTRGIPMYMNSFINVLSSDKVYNVYDIKRAFQFNMDQILIMWVRIWGSLNDYEKQIILSFLSQEKQTWTELFNDFKSSKGTFNKYLENLRNKGIIEYDKPYYFLADKMLKTWLIHEKEVTGVYPF